jgi:hypothetical protein
LTQLSLILVEEMLWGSQENTRGRWTLVNVIVLVGMWMGLFVTGRVLKVNLIDVRSESEKESNHIGLKDEEFRLRRLANVAI